MRLQEKHSAQQRTADIIMGSAYYNILKYQRSLILHEGGSPAVRARHSVWLRESFL
jgi:hypothetical protein